MRPFRKIFDSRSSENSLRAEAVFPRGDEVKAGGSLAGLMDVASAARRGNKGSPRPTLVDCCAADHSYYRAEVPQP